MKILIVEDEPKVASFLTVGLEELGFDVLVAVDGQSAVEIFNKESLDILLLDIVLPDISGTELCRKFKGSRPDLPIIMLTALGTLDDKLDGFGAGADDYLVKPFEFRELVARINAHTKKPHNPGSAANVLKVGKVELDLDQKLARREGKEILLSAKEFALLELLMKSKERVLSRAEIAEKVWDISFDTGTNVVDVYINMLRKKIDKDFTVKHIHTRIGLGYIFQEE
jgi:two-component system, OmpR family, copper resistance phosphate regulon response regulator CusR